MSVTHPARVWVWKSEERAGVAAVAGAMVMAVVLGAVAYLFDGIGMLTGCTDDYDCTTTGCAPCQGVDHWLQTGVVIQGALVVVGLTFLVLALALVRVRRVLVVVAVVIGISSWVAYATTKSAASHSYCQPGDSSFAPGCGVG